MVEDLTGMVDTGNMWIIGLSFLVVFLYSCWVFLIRKKVTVTISAESESTSKIVRDIETGKTYELKEVDKKL